MDAETRRSVALWRYSVLGPLVSARLEHGDRRRIFTEAAQRLYEHPSGRRLKLSPRTIESWYYAYRQRGLAGLEPNARKDSGQTRALDPELADLIVRAKRERPRRSIRQIIKILVRARRAAPGQLHPATVHRVLRRAGVSTRPQREHDRERRSFLPTRAGDLWQGDVLHGPRALADTRLIKTYLISIQDGATRYIVDSEFRPSERAADHEAVLKRAIAINGRPRAYYVDLGAAYVAKSLRGICADLGIELLHTRPRDASAKGAIERWHQTWRAEVGDELAGTTRTLAGLNAAHHAWLSREYHARVHSTTNRAPREHFLAEVADGAMRPVPRSINLAEVFWHRAKRRVRKDGTVHFNGRRLEVRAELTGHRVELRYDPANNEMLPKVYVDGAFVCDTVPLDLQRNTRRRRRPLPASDKAVPEPTGLDPIADLEREHYGVALDPDAEECPW